MRKLLPYLTAFLLLAAIAVGLMLTGTADRRRRASYDGARLLLAEERISPNGEKAA